MKLYEAKFNSMNDSMKTTLSFEFYATPNNAKEKAFEEMRLRLKGDYEFKANLFYCEPK